MKICLVRYILSMLVNKSVLAIFSNKNTKCWQWKYRFFSRMPKSFPYTIAIHTNFFQNYRFFWSLKLILCQITVAGLNLKQPVCSGCKNGGKKAWAKRNRVNLDKFRALGWKILSNKSFKSETNLCFHGHPFHIGSE